MAPGGVDVALRVVDALSLSLTVAPGVVAAIPDGRGVRAQRGVVGLHFTKLKSTMKFVFATLAATSITPSTIKSPHPSLPPFAQLTAF